MQKSLKKISRKSLSLLIALIMVISAMPFSPLSSPIEADAAEIKTNIDVWNATNTNGTLSMASNPRFSATDSVTGYSLSGVRWGGSTINTNSSDNTKYLTIGNASLSCATLSSTSETTPPTASGFAEKNIKGKKWSFSAKFAYTGPNTSGTYTATTVFGIGTSDTYSYNNKSSSYNESNAMVANLVDIRENGKVYIALSNETSTPINPTLTLSTENRNKLATDSASNPKVLTVTYDNGYLSIDINGDVIVAPRAVDSALFEKGVSNFFMGANVQVYRGGTAPYYQVSNNSAYIYNMNLYSLSGATYQTTGGGSEPTAPTNKTISVIGYGILKNTGEDNRASSNVLGIVNDQQDANFDIGFVNFDISSLSNSEFNVASAIYKMTYSMASRDREAKGLSFYYATRNNDAFNRTDQPANFTNTTYDSNIFGTDNQHIANATSYLGLVNIGSVNTATNTTNASIPIDLAPAIKYALKKGENRVQLLIMLKEAGGSGSTDGWTDTNVTVPTTPVSVTMQTDADYVKANINVEGKVNKNYSNIVENNAGAYTGNVIVADQWTASQNNTNYLETNQIASDNLRFYAYNNAVALYTGAGNIRFPIVLEKVAVSNPSNFDVYQNIEYTALNNGGPFSLGNDNNQWQYCTSSTNLTDAVSGTGEGQVVSNFSNSTTASKDSYREDGSNINYAKNDKFGTPTTKAFKNYIKYTGSGNSDTYYDKLSSPTFSYRADYAVFWKDRYWYLTNVHDKAFTLNSDFNCYVLNYKPLYDIVSNASFKDNYNQISQNSSKYSQEGLNNYYAVVADIIDFNLANEPMTSESEVEAVATKIKDLVTRYNSYKTPELKQYTVTFHDLLGSVTLKTLRVTPGTTINESDLPKLTTPKYYQNNQHYIYYWKNSDNTEFTVPYTVNDNVAISESRKIENCNFAVKSISGNTSTVSCSVCNGGTYTLDIEGYNNIVSVAREAINDTVKYDSDSRANLQTVLNNNNTVNDCITMEQINAKISAIQTAINALVPEKYSVTLHYYDSTGTPLYSESGNIKEIVSDIPYGKLQPISVSGKFNENYVVYKWTRDVDGQNKISGLNSDTLNVVVKENADYYVFLKNTTVDNSQATGNAVITLNNKSNKVVDIGYLDKTSGTASVMISDNTITVGGVMLTAPMYSFYNVSGFTINGQPVTSGDSITITDKIVIKPVYEPTLDAFIKRAENETFLINGKAENLAVKWNQKVVLNTTDGTEVAWIAGIDRDGNGTIDSTEKNIVGYGSSYSFYANSNVTFYTELTTVNAPKTSIGLFSYNENENKVTLVNNFYAPSGYTVKYAGVVLSTKTDDRDKLIAQTNGRFFGDESDFSGNDSNKNQIRISVTRTATTSFDMHALAYIIVQNPNGTEETIYADNVETIHYTVN